MSTQGKMIKDLMKVKKESMMGKLANEFDPMEPWSAKSDAPIKNSKGLSEEESLDESNNKILFNYVKSLGYDPKFMPFAKLSTYSRSDAFKRYKQGHIFDRNKQDIKTEEVVAEGSGESHIIVRTDSEGKKDVFAGNFDTYERAQKELDGLLAHPLHTKYKQKFEIKRKGGEQGVAEENLSELNKDTLYSYANKADKDIAKRHKELGAQIRADKSVEANKNSAKIGNRYAGTDRAETRLNKESTICTNCQVDPCICDDSHGFVNEARMSVAVRMQRAIERQRAKSDASLRRTPSSIPKKEEPKKDVAEETIQEAGTGHLMSFIKAKGLSPLAMDGNQKKAYSRSSEYKIFKARHQAEMVKETSGMGERADDWDDGINPAGRPAPLAKKKTVKEEADAKDVVSMDIPLLIRVLEFIREDVKTDMDLHRVVENLIDLRTEGVLTMDHYDKAVKINMKEEVESIDELSKSTLKSYVDKVATTPGRGMTPKGTLKSIKAIGGVTKAIRKQYEKPLSELKKTPDNMDSDDIGVAREESDPCWKGYQMVGMKKKGGRSVPNCVPESVSEGIYGIEDSPTAATHSVKAMESKKISNAAKMVKAIHKKRVNETTYDWEKSEKGGDTDPEVKTTAKITLKGGKTMTGKPRDTVEIEPVLRTKINSLNGMKPNV